MFSLVNYVGAGLMLAGVLLPLVNEDSRNAIDIPLLGTSSKSEKVRQYAVKMSST